MPRRKPGGKQGVWFAYAPVDDGLRPSPRRPRPWRDVGDAHPGANLDPDMPVKLMPEYTRELPIWHYEWWELGLDIGLLDRLADWQAEFDANFVPERGWMQDDIRDGWAAEADRLVQALKAALPDGIELEVDLWPIRRRNRTGPGKGR